MTSRRPMSAVEAQVLQILRQASQPLGAYAILNTLRSEGVNAPPTVYRALRRLVADGLVHRVQSRNAFVACDHPAHSDPIVIGVCGDCNATVELEDSDAVARLNRRARAAGFRVTDMTLELEGQCERCAAEAGDE